MKRFFILWAALHVRPARSFLKLPGLILLVCSCSPAETQVVAALRCQSAIRIVGFHRICIFLGGLPHAGEVEAFGGGWEEGGEGMEFALLKKASENKFIQQLAGWQNCRKSCFGAEGWSGWFPEVAVQGIVSPRLFRVECFSRYTEVMQSSVVWTVKHTDATDTG